jgi:hypothetical protein
MCRDCRVRAPILIRHGVEPSRWRGAGSDRQEWVEKAMHMRVAMLIVLAVMFAAGTAILPMKSSRVANAADEGAGVARVAALSLQISQPGTAETASRYQSVATSLTGQRLAAADFAETAVGARYDMVAVSLATDGGTGTAPLALIETDERFQAVADMLVGRGLQPTARQDIGAADVVARYQLAAAALAARPIGGPEAPAVGGAARYEAVSSMVAGRELAAAPVESASWAVEPARLAAALAMAPLAEHETEEEPEEENGGSSGDGETFESANYDYTVTFDDAVWEVVNESEEEDDAGNPFEVLQLGSEAAVVTFYGLTADFNDAEDCVESLEDFVAGVEGIDDVEERDDIEGDDEDSSVVIDYLYEPEGADETEWTSLLRCQMIEEDEVFLMTWYDALHDNYEDDDNEEAREELLEGVEVG